MNSLVEFNQRQNKEISKLLRYSRYIFNDYFVIFLFFLIGGLMYQYGKWLQSPHTNLTLPYVLWSLVVILMLSVGKVATYLQEADRLYFLPVMSKLSNFMKKAYFSSLLLPLIGLAIFIGVSYPFLNLQRNLNFYTASLLFLTFALLKASQLLIQILSLHFDFMHTTKSLSLTLIHVLVTFLSVGLIGLNHNLIGLLLSVLWLAFLVINRPFKDGTSWNLEKGIEKEEARKHKQDQLLSLFVEIKQMKAPVKRRRYLDYFLPKKKTPEDFYTFLFARQFWRGGESFPIWLRLVFIGMILSALLPAEGFSGLILGFYLVLGHMQFISLYQDVQRRTNPLLVGLSTDENLIQENYRRFLKTPLWIQGTLQALIFAFAHLNALPIVMWVIFLEIGVAMTYLYTFLPLEWNKKTQRQKRRRRR